MKIAIPAKDNIVDDHFGHCSHFVIYTIDETKGKKESELMPTQQGCGCKSNIVPELRRKGVEVMLAGNMGNAALNLLQKHGIKVYRGCSGDLDSVIEDYINGQIQDSGEDCRQHAHHTTDHGCNH